VWVGVNCPVNIGEPSPKSQLKVSPFVELFVKSTSKGAHPKEGVTETLIFGRGLTVIVLVIWYVHPLELFVAVNVIS